MTIHRYEIADSEWERIREYAPQRKPEGHQKIIGWQMLNTMLWMARSGTVWEDLPARYGPWKSVYSRFCKWRDEGVLATIFTAPCMDADYENLCIDSTSIKVHQHTAGAKKGLPDTKATRK